MDQYIPGQANVKNVTPIDPKCMLLPKLGLMKNFVKTLDKEGDASKYLSFFKLSNAKLRKGIFIGTQIGKILIDEQFDSKLSHAELPTWNPFKRIVSKVLRNKKVENYEKLAEKLLKNYCKMGYQMSFKIHFLQTY